MRRLLAALLGAAVLTLPAPAGAVVGGDEADPGEWPWQVAVLLRQSLICGGTLVSLDVVLTAAHCTEDLGPGDLTVVAGVVDLDDPEAQRRDVASIDQHEGYDPGSHANDVALLHLESRFIPDDEVAPVALPDPATAAELTGDGATTVVTGFGSTTEDGPASDVLLEAEVEVLDDRTCIGRYAEDGDVVDADTNLCAGHDRGHVDACFGDSGGPLVAPGGDDESEWYLVGVVAWGAGCGRPLRPTVYMEVAAFSPWLAANGAVGAAGERFDGDDLRLPARGTRGKASDYPATVEVAGVDGEVTSIAVELHGLTHERPADLDVWLVAPDGTAVTLLSDVGGDETAEDLEVVVQADGPEAGGATLPLRVAPTDRRPDTQRKGPRPPASFEDLRGIDPTGEWQLLVADDSSGGRGTLDGWTLVLNVG